MEIYNRTHSRTTGGVSTPHKMSAGRLQLQQFFSASSDAGANTLLHAIAALLKQVELQANALLHATACYCMLLLHTSSRAVMLSCPCGLLCSHCCMAGHRTVWVTAPGICKQHNISSHNAAVTM